VKEEIDDLLATFRKNGFVDSIQFKAMRGVSIPRYRDSGMIALAPNPWSPEHLVCICGGAHAPGAAGALQMLSKPSSFVDGPWGRVVVIQVSHRARWEEPFKHLNPVWETHENTLKKSIENLSFMIQAVKQRRKTDKKIVTNADRLEGVMKFVKGRLIRKADESSTRKEEPFEIK
jgi:hypothetical protein